MGENLFSRGAAFGKIGYGLGTREPEVYSGRSV
jgi:hypothetical protein